ncbi:MAG: hypothetical protein K2X48_01660 [Chitinophagaceae bacterium]|nr:hypothetical protein [Chitinophagaceae bacterium]
MFKLRILILVFFAGLVFTASAQLKAKVECNVIFADVYKGWINQAKPNDDPEQIKAKLPCFTSFEKESNESKCGGGIYYDDKDFKFLIQRDYLVIGEKFKGKLSIPLMGAKQDALFTWFGNPKIKDANWEAYQMQYGTLIVYFNTKKLVNKIIITPKSTEEIDLCDDK